jgi:hypothetical protein
MSDQRSGGEKQNTGNKPMPAKPQTDQENQTQQDGSGQRLAATPPGQRKDDPSEAPESGTRDRPTNT